MGRISRGGPGKECYHPRGLLQTGQGAGGNLAMQSIQKGAPHDLHAYTARSFISLAISLPPTIRVPRRPPAPIAFLHLRQRLSRGSGAPFFRPKILDQILIRRLPSQSRSIAKMLATSSPEILGYFLLNALASNSPLADCDCSVPSFSPPAAEAAPAKRPVCSQIATTSSTGGITHRTPRERLLNNLRNRSLNDLNSGIWCLP